MSKCLKHECQYLQTTCVTCGRIVCTKALPKIQEWVSVKERSPPYRTPVLVFDRYHAVRTGGHIKQASRIPRMEKSYWKEEDGIAPRYSHWMPLPEPPK
jgi:hypothetical protein